MIVDEVSDEVANIPTATVGNDHPIPAHMNSDIPQVPSHPTDHQTVPVLPVLLLRGASVAHDDPAVVEASALVQPDDQPQTISQVSDTQFRGSLDPNALTFVSTASSQEQIAGHPRRKSTARGKKNAIPVDPAGVELEFVKIEISTLQAKLQKQETELKDLKFRNSILMARNKTLEEVKKQSIHDQYFPPQPSTANSHPQSENHCRVQACCSHPIIQYQCTTKHCPSPDQSTPESNSIVYINTKLAELSKTVLGLKEILDKLMQVNTSSQHTTKADSVPPCTQNVPSHPIPANSTYSPALESSTISLDEFMFNEDDSEKDLN